jgi:hypothetical protein
MDVGVVMRGEILADKRADGRAGRRLATWNTLGVIALAGGLHGWFLTSARAEVAVLESAVAKWARG